jgi:hypothetical protein
VAAPIAARAVLESKLKKWPNSPLPVKKSTAAYDIGVGAAELP